MATIASEIKKGVTSWPSQTIVIPVRNEQKHIATTIAALQSQDYPRDRFEIIVVDGESDDGTVRIVEEMAATDSRIRILKNSKRLSSAARNIGARAARGEIITYIDGHTHIEGNRLLMNIAIVMREKKVSVLSRPQFMETPHNTFFQQAVALARRSRFGHGLDSTIYLEDEKYVEATSSGASYKKEVFDNVGYFDEDFDAAEDLDFNFRVDHGGYKSFSSPRLSVFYYPRNTLLDLFHQMERYGIGRFRFLRKHHTGLGSGTLFPALLVLGPPIALLLSIIWPFLLWPLALGAVLYVALDLLSAVYIAINHGFGYIKVIPDIYIVIHLGLGYGFLLEMIRTLAGRGVKLTG